MTFLWSIWPNYNISPHALPQPTTALEWRPPKSTSMHSEPDDIYSVTGYLIIQSPRDFAIFLSLFKWEQYAEYCFSPKRGLSPSSSGILRRICSVGSDGMQFKADDDSITLPSSIICFCVSSWSLTCGLCFSPDCWLNPNKCAVTQSFFVSVGKNRKFKRLLTYLIELLKLDISVRKLDRMIAIFSFWSSVAYFGFDGCPKFKE